MPPSPQSAPRVAVVGLGFVGLPLSLSYWQSGATVIGVETEATLRAELLAGRTHHLEADNGRPIAEILQDALASGRYTVIGSDAEAARSTDASIVTVGVPHGPSGLDLEPLQAALQELIAAAPQGHLILLRSTVPPGTTRALLYEPALQAGRRVGEDLFVAYCPERIAEGRAFQEVREMPVILAAFDEPSRERATALVSRVTKAGVVPSQSVEATELAKVTENVQRDVNIAVVQELARACEPAGIDVFEVIRLANTHHRVHLLQPGPGVGGFCLPLALSYLLPLAARHDVPTPTLLAARRTNAQVPALLARQAADHARRIAAGAPARVAVLGLAMKDYSNDARLSPAVEVCRRLQELGCEVRAVDPAVPQAFSFQGEDAAWAVDGAHALLLLARQTVLESWLSDLDRLRALAPGALVLDARYWLAPRRPEVEELGLAYWLI